MERIDRCWRAPIFALSASSDPPFGASYSGAPRALHGLPSAGTVRQNRGILWVKGMPNACTSCATFSRTVSLETKFARCACAEIGDHLKVDAEIPDIDLGEPLGEQLRIVLN